MAILYLMIRIAGERLALAADSVESVVEFEAITPVPRVAPHILGLAALRSRVVTVIDVRIAVGLPAAPATGPLKAVIAVIDGQTYGLAVDDVDDVAEASARLPLRAPLAGGWGAAAAGMIEQDGALMLLLDPAALVAPRTPIAA